MFHFRMQGFDGLKGVQCFDLFCKPCQWDGVCKSLFSMAQVSMAQTVCHLIAMIGKIWDLERWLSVYHG